MPGTAPPSVRDADEAEPVRRRRHARMGSLGAVEEFAHSGYDLEAAAILLLECDGCRRLIMSFDLMIVGAELQEMILAKLAMDGFKPSEVLLLASHTHFAPATDQACARLGVPETQFVRDVAEAAEGLVLKMLQVCGLRPA